MADSYAHPLSPHLAHRQRSHNRVVVKDDVGRAPPSCYDLPPEDYVYGACESAGATGQGVRDALSWVSHVPSPPRRPGVDYQRVNREAARSHVTSPKELAKFRSGHDFRLSPHRPSHGPPAVLPSDAIPGYAYGQPPARASEDAGALLAHRFGAAAEERQEERYRRYDEERARNAGPLKVRLTKAGSYRRQPPAEPEEDPKRLWKMKKFQRVPASSRRHSDSPPPAGERQRRSPSGASLPELPRAERTPARQLAHREASPPPTLEEVLQAARVPGDGGGVRAAACSDVEEEETEAGSDGGWRSEGDTAPGSPRSGEGRWDPDLWPDEQQGSPRAGEGRWDPDLWPDEQQGAARRQHPEVDSAPGGEAGLDEAEATPRPARRVDTVVKLLLTVSHELPEELNAATHAMAGCIRSRFPDSLVRVLEVAIEQPRQGMREEHGRYAAWGLSALRSRPTAEGGKAHVMSPVVLSLSVRHASRQELEAAQRAVVERIRGYFPEGVVQLHGIRPPLPPLGAREGPPRELPHEGAPGTPGRPQVRFRSEISMQEGTPRRYPLRPRTRDGQPRRPRASEAAHESPPKSPWK